MSDIKGNGAGKGFVRGNAWGVVRGGTPYLDEIPQLWVALAIGSTWVEAPSVAEPTT